MSHLRPVAPPACAHCGAPVPRGGDGAFCCAGCAGAHALVSGLGLDAFYRRRAPAALAAAALRPPAAAPDTAFAVRAARPEDADGATHALDLLVPGLACGACVWLLEQALAAEPDVLRARASLADRRLRLLWRGPRERAAALAALPARLGFGVAPWSAACLRAAEDAEGRALLRALGIAAFGAANVMLLSVAMWFGGGMGEGTRRWLHALTAAIALPVVAVAGLPFYRNALAGLRAGRATMDLAVSLGVLATAAMSAERGAAQRPLHLVRRRDEPARACCWRGGCWTARRGAGRSAPSPGCSPWRRARSRCWRRTAPPAPRRRPRRAPATACWSRRASGSAWTACWNGRGGRRRRRRRCSTSRP